MFIPWFSARVYDFARRHWAVELVAEERATTMRRGATVRFRIRNSPSTLRISTHISRPRGDPLSSHVAPEYSRRAAPLRSGLQRPRRKLVGRWA